MNNKEIAVDLVLEDLQKAIIEVGGRFYRRSELKSLDFGEMLNSFVRNGVVFEIKSTLKVPEYAQSRMDAPISNK